MFRKKFDGLKREYRDALEHYLERKDQEEIDKTRGIGRQLVKKGFRLEEFIGIYLTVHRDVAPDEDATEVERNGLICGALIETIQAYGPSAQTYEKLFHMQKADYEKMTTAFREKQDELSAANNELRQTLSELDRQNEELKKINQFKSELVSMMAHELRTPLNSVKIFLDLITNGELGEVNSEAESAVDKSLYNVNRLIGMVNDFLDLSNVETGKIKMNFEPTFMDQVVKSSIIGVKALADEGGVELEVGQGLELSSPLLADREKIEQLLINLLSNAVKFTPPGGRVTVDFSVREDRLQVNVSDTGVGIAENEVDKVFGKFQKISSKPFRDTKGSGLGLAISKAIVSAHGGEVWAESKEKVGSTFHFTLPLGENPIRKTTLGEI